MLTGIITRRADIRFHLWYQKRDFLEVKAADVLALRSAIIQCNAALRDNLNLAPVVNGLCGTEQGRLARAIWSNVKPQCRRQPAQEPAALVLPAITAAVAAAMISSMSPAVPASP